MKTLILNGSDIYRGSLILVNTAHPLIGEIEENELSPVWAGRDDILLERQTAGMLRGVTSFLCCRGQIKPVSGYRTAREQQSIYESTMRENGRRFTRRYVAAPGCSEHQTGLAVDLAENREDIDFIRPDFPYTGIYGEFRRLAVRCGFIERYPADREDITHIAHEPWHFRYVGRPHAEIMSEKSLTLEEYTEYLRKFSKAGSHLRFSLGKRSFEIFHIPIPGAKTVVEIPESAHCQVSGNNVDGVVVTLQRTEP